MTTETELVPQTLTDAPAPQELSEVELLRLENARLKDETAALKKDRAECVDLAEEAEAKLRDHEDLKGRAKKAKDEWEILADALSKRVRGEVQTEIDPEDDEQAEIEFKPQAAPFPEHHDAIELTDLDWSAVERSALSALVSTGKPAKVKPVEIMSLEYVMVDVQNRIAVMCQLMDAETFVDRYKIEGALRPDERSSELQALGEYAGIPVKVGRKVFWLAPEPLLVKMPPDVAVVPAEASSDIVSNRIYAELEAVEFMTVDAMVKLVGVERDIVQLSASRDSRLIYDPGKERISRA